MHYKRTQNLIHQTSTVKKLSDSTVTSGLKEALRIGVDYGVKELSKEGGYFNNKEVKIPLPQNLSKAETIIRKVGGEKIADDLVASMNKAATQAAPKTATIFVDAVDKMTLNDAQKILSGNKDAATNYFKDRTTTSLQAMIKPIIQKSMQDNSVASYYDTFNTLYKSYAKDTLNNTAIMQTASNFGADTYLPSSSDEKLDDYITQKAMDGLFKMIAKKEGEIRTDTTAQITDLLKEVFGN